MQDQTGQRPSTVQQNLDFELDVKVDIESGLCILHPATDPDKEPDANDARLVLQGYSTTVLLYCIFVSTPSKKAVQQDNTNRAVVIYQRSVLLNHY